jgi:hypothetical protein
MRTGIRVRRMSGSWVHHGRDLGKRSADDSVSRLCYHPRMKIALAVVTSVLVAALIAMFVIVSSLSGQVSTLYGDRSHDQQQISGLQNQLDDDEQKLQDLNEPQDPLSAYTGICHQDMFNSGINEYQTWYFPCTNNAQTIPQPAG